MKLKYLVKNNIKAVALFIALAGAASSSYAAPILYQGHDAGAGTLASAPNSTAAASSFDTALPGLSLIDFENPLPPGFSFAGDGFLRNTQRCAPALCGYNTTTGGQWFLDATYNTSFNFVNPIDSFGAYFTGVQRGDATLTYSDNSVVTLPLPPAGINSGGTTFFGFSDPGASIVSISYFTGTGGDFVGVDDIRYGNARQSVPEPAFLGLLGLGLAGLGLSRRKK